ncbi:MAG: S8 family serine peptidase [Chloroflexi bacterium]|nr:S8 family serine peptidase [Chloroflexota bacterium]
MRKSRTVAWLAIVMALAIIWTPGGKSLSAEGESNETINVQLPPKGHEKLQSRLDQMVKADEQGKAASFAQQHGLEAQGGRVRVVIEAKPGNEAAVLNKAQSLGGTQETSYQNLLQVLMPLPRLKTLADDDNVKFIRLPRKAVPLSIGQGVGVINADVWQNAGFNGTGMKIGIIDEGFYGYTSLLGNELPASVTTWFIGGPGNSEHGTAIAEIIYDIAPNAQFFLANFDTYVDYANAVSWMISQGVDVISSSIGWLGTGPGDGTGPIADLVTSAKNAGILWAQAAGNSARRHWSGSWSDTNGNGYHNFTSSDEGQTINNVQAGETIVVFLTWNDPWGTSSNDYDLLLFNPSGTLVDASQDRQNGIGSNDEPIEAIDYTVPAGAGGNYYLAIGKWSANDLATFHLTGFGQNFEYQVAAGSLLQPADSQNALTVGAVFWNNPSTIEVFSSQGPTTTGAIKPDIVAPDGVSSEAYGGNFYGTSAAAPHVAGAALLVKQRFPSYTPTQIQSYLESNAVGLGAEGKDNVFGSGRLYLPALTVAPQISFTPATDTTITAGQTLTFVAQLDGGSPVADADWKWDFDYQQGDTDVSATGMTPAAQGWGNIASTYVVRLTATNEAGTTAVTRTITVQPAAAHHLTVTESAGGTNNTTINAGSSLALTIKAFDQYGNLCSSGANAYTGAKNLDFSGPVASPSGNQPTVEGVNIEGTGTVSVNFTGGVSTAGAATLITYKAESTTVDVSDGAVNSTVDPAWDLDLTVNRAALDHVTLSPDTAFLRPTTSQQFNASAYDQYGNAVSGPGLTYTWSVVNGGGSIDVGGLFTAGGATGTFVNTVKAEATADSVTKEGTATAVIGPSMTMTATLQGTRLPPEGQDYKGYNVPLKVKLYNEAVTNLNIKTLSPVANGTLSTADGNVIITGVNSSTITFTVGALPPAGTYWVTLHSPHNLVNLKNSVAIAAQGTVIDMGTLLEGDAQDITEGSVIIDIQDFVRFGNAYETGPGMANWNATADFDRNGWVRISDFGLLYQNYGKTSPQTVP